MLANLNTHGGSRLGYKFSCPYIRNSGDPWTTLFNTMWAQGNVSYALCGNGETDYHPAGKLILAGGDDVDALYMKASNR